MHREVGWPKDLSAPLYKFEHCRVFCKAITYCPSLINLRFKRGHAPDQ